jgi:hypothetical protein
MALLWVEGFEQYALAADMQRAVPGQSATIADVVLGRDGWGSAMNFDSAATSYKIPCDFGSNPTYTLGFAWNPGSVSTRDLVQIVHSESVSLELELQASGEIEINRSFTQLDITSGLGITGGTWYYCEFEFYIHDSLGTYELRVNGANVMSGGPVDTKATSTTSSSKPTGIWLNGSSVGSQYFDDIYLIDDTGLTNNSFLGDCVVETLYPDGDGTTNDFTPLSGLTNYEMVDDGSTPDTGTTYVSSSTVNHIDLYTFEDLVQDVTDIYGVRVGAMGRVMSAGPRQVRCLARSGGVNYEGNAFGLPPDYVHQHHLWEVNPNTAAAWTEANFNSAEFGYTIEA